MLDYTDISGKIEDVKRALDSLYNLIYGQYNGIFDWENDERYQRMLQKIRGADRCLNEANDLNDRLSDAFEKIWINLKKDQDEDDE